MHLTEVLKQHPDRPTQSVPEWMLGCFKRNRITFANGLTDQQTHVFWLQGRNLTIDLRLPLASSQVTSPLMQCTPEQLEMLANNEGWYAESAWYDGVLSWSGGTSLQLHNRWPEPALLQRIGNCMMEFAPSGAYVEDWRLQSCQPGPLVSLKLLEQRNVNTGELQHRDGALIITGDWAGLVLGRKETLAPGSPSDQLRDRIRLANHDPAFISNAFHFETSVAHGSLEQGYITAFSTCHSRIGSTLCSLEGFSMDEEHGLLVQQSCEHDTIIERRFQIDTLEHVFPFRATSNASPEAQHWFDAETPTLARYATVIN
jgi:hypothetical protein